ncbi:hypothetical protein [Fusobacterium sp. SYSU M8D902]|uniref:hypothetical protein n=1 Tax=Fusobacterium sp. SYSU M8D902 TaxID=3159562 RepID=UPI0032E4CFAF
MKRIIKSIVIISLLLLTSCGRVTEQQARQALHNHLLERYGEEFEIGYMGRRSTGKKNWYQAEIYPSKYKGTPREYDKYYHRSGNVNIEKGIFGESIDYVGDVYRIVLMNESANEFYLPKLKELFGENILPILDINISELEFFPNFIDDYTYNLKKNKMPEIKGRIYIFGRVENDKDREWYRKQIYEFVQFMKQTGTFEYVDLDILVVDERILLDEFIMNKIGTIDKLENLSKDLSEEEFLRNRKNIMNELNSFFDKNKYYQKSIENINKNNLREIGTAIYTKGNNLLYLKLYSPKYIESNRYKNEKREYNDISDIKFDWERWF